MRYVVAYDISEDSIRLDVAKVLEGAGMRVQESVFECNLGDGELDPLVKRLRGILVSREHGQIRFYRVCRDCYQASFGFGEIAADGARPAIVVG